MNEISVAKIHPLSHTENGASCPLSDYRTFTSESVGEGHPDKLCDQISDAILDAALTKDPEARVACEVLLKSTTIVVAGEVTTDVALDYSRIAREVVSDVGYTREDLSVDPSDLGVMVLINQQSSEIGEGIGATGESNKELGAGDQGMMFGYATNETTELMPAPILYSHRLMRRHKEVRAQGSDFLRPDAKCQLTFEYANGAPVRVQSIVFATQHTEWVSEDFVSGQVYKNILKPTLSDRFDITEATIHINSAGSWIKGGPATDCGLTGRKIIVDTYGGMARHGGGAFSGKDPSKVDRSAAYAARHVAKNIVAAGLADRCEVQVSYAIGEANPVDVSVNSFGTAADGLDDSKLGLLVREHFDLKPLEIIKRLDLRRPIYRKTATFGHFGHTDPSYTWEQTNLVDALKADANQT